MNRYIAFAAAMGPTATARAAETEGSSGGMYGFAPSDECIVEMPEDIAYDCGYLAVPEYHDQRSGGAFSGGVIRLRAKTEKPKEPIFFGSGG
jgi:hypothetical protein